MDNYFGNINPTCKIKACMLSWLKVHWLSEYQEKPYWCISEYQKHLKLTWWLIVRFEVSTIKASQQKCSSIKWNDTVPDKSNLLQLLPCLPKIAECNVFKLQNSHKQSKTSHEKKYIWLVLYKIRPDTTATSYK